MLGVFINNITQFIWLFLICPGGFQMECCGIPRYLEFSFLKYSISKYIIDWDIPLFPGSESSAWRIPYFFFFMSFWVTNQRRDYWFDISDIYFYWCSKNNNKNKQQLNICMTKLHFIFIRWTKNILCFKTP